jgi:hypothetical protein
MSGLAGTKPSWAEIDDINRRRYGSLSVPARLRRAKLLKKASADRLYFHCQGGMPVDDPDVSWLVRHGYLRVVRAAYAQGWVNDVRHPYDLRRTKGVITEQGWDALWNERF